LNLIDAVFDGNASHISLFSIEILVTVEKITCGKIYAISSMVNILILDYHR
jgi:hypothetical protein